MFSAKLIKLLEVKNTKQGDLADSIGKSISQISRYCSGASEPNYSTINDIANFFNVDASYFFSGVANNKTDSGDILFIRGAIFQLVSFQYKDHVLIYNAWYSTSRYLDKRVVGLLKKYKIKVVIILKKGKILIDNKEIKFGIIDSFESVFVEENTTFQVVFSGNVIPLVKEIKRIYKSKSLI